MTQALEPREPRAERFRFRQLLWSAAIGGALGAVLIGTLAARVPNISGGPATRPQPGWGGLRVPLLETAGPAPPVYVLWLHARQPLELLLHSEVRLLFATNGKNPDLADARLEILGTDCVLATPPDSRLNDNDVLSFVPAPQCSLLREQPTGDIRLVVRVAHRDPIALWAYQVPDEEAAGQVTGAVIVGPARQTGPAPVVMARYVDRLGAATTRRLDLLAYMWQLSPRWIWAGVAVAIALAIVGGWAMPLSVSAPSWTIRHALSAGAASAA